MIYKAIGRGWIKSAHWYGGRTWTLALVTFLNLVAVILFGGGLMLLLLAAADDTCRAMVTIAALYLGASLVPMVAVALLNRKYRRRCKTCNR